MNRNKRGADMKTSAMKTIMTIAILAGMLALTSCGTTRNEEFPIGIGTGPDSLKLSPCACMTIPNDAQNPDYRFPIG